jgi:hypothetical protein
MPSRVLSPRVTRCRPGPRIAACQCRSSDADWCWQTAPLYIPTRNLAESAPQIANFLGEIPMNIIIGALVTVVVVLLILYLVNMLPIDGRTKQIVRIIVIIIGILSLLKYLTVF